MKVEKGPNKSRKNKIGFLPTQSASIPFTTKDIYL